MLGSVLPGSCCVVVFPASGVSSWEKRWSDGGDGGRWPSRCLKRLSAMAVMRWLVLVDEPRLTLLDDGDNKQGTAGSARRWGEIKQAAAQGQPGPAERREPAYEGEGEI